MDRWRGRVAVVTGASAGIGAAVCKLLANNGMKVVGCARRIENIEELSKQNDNIIPMKCDVGNEDEVDKMFQWIENNPSLGRVDICIPNAGFSTDATLMEGCVSDWKNMLNVNVVGLNQCTQLAIKSMLKNNITDGQIVMVNSMSGHRVPPGNLRFYSATKFAVTGLVEGWRQELRSMDPPNNIRVAQLCPGLVKTEFQEVAFGKNNNIFAGDNQPLVAEDMANSIKFIIEAPPHVQIHDIMVRPTYQKF